METKECSKCKEIKLLEDFAWQYKKKKRKQPKCKSCMNAYAGIVRRIKRESLPTKRISKIKTERVSIPRTRTKTRVVRVRKESKVRYGGSCIVRYTPEFLLVYQQGVARRKKEYMQSWRAANKGYQHIYHTQRKQIDPIFALKLATRSLLSQSFKRACKGSYYKKKHTQEILQCSLEFFIQYIQDQFIEGMTLENYGEWHLDHIIPIASAKTEEDIIRLNHYTNFQPLWAKDNLSKGSKIIQ